MSTPLSPSYDPAADAGLSTESIIFIVLQVFTFLGLLLLCLERVVKQMRKSQCCGAAVEWRQSSNDQIKPPPPPSPKASV